MTKEEKERFYQLEQKVETIEVDTNNNVDRRPYDEDGNVYVGRVVFRSLRKIGKLEWYDEDGTIQKKLVDENYKPDKTINENVTWFWINEWHEVTRIADDIYVKMQSRPIQFRRMGNRSAGGSGYVGTIYNIAGSKGKSLMDCTSLVLILLVSMK